MKAFRVFLWIILCLIFISGFLYFLHGSLEMFPTPEATEKARTTAVVMMVLPVICGIALCFRKK